MELTQRVATHTTAQCAKLKNRTRPFIRWTTIRQAGGELWARVYRCQVAAVASSSAYRSRVQEEAAVAGGVRAVYNMRMPHCTASSTPLVVAFYRSDVLCGF